MVASWKHKPLNTLEQSIQSTWLSKSCGKEGSKSTQEHALQTKHCYEHFNVIVAGIASKIHTS